jgi:riboflavin transporter FmnP
MHASATIVRDIASIMLLFSIPVLVFLPRLKPGAGGLVSRMLISTVVTWLALVLFYWFIGLPISRAIGETQTDGQERLARHWIIAYGCIPAAVGTAITAVAFSVIRYVRKKHHTTA